MIHELMPKYLDIYCSVFYIKKFLNKPLCLHSIKLFQNNLYCKISSACLLRLSGSNYILF